MRASKQLLLLLALPTSLFLAACAEEKVEEKPVVRPVKMFTVGGAGAGGEREFPGTLKAAQHADMAFEVPGKITEFLVKEGVEVEKGQELARLDNRDYVNESEKQKANLRKAQSDLKRSLSIQKEDAGAISQETIDTHKRAVDVAKAALAQSEKAVEDTVLVAPFAGLMARKLVEDFQNVKAKEPVLVLQDISHMEIEVSVPERDVVGDRRPRGPEQITEEIKPRVVVTSIPDKTFPARVKEFATTADPITRTFQVRFTFESPDDKVLPGMTAKIIIDALGATDGDTFLLPVNAVAADSENKPYVWLVDPDSMQVKRQPVEIGELTGSSIPVSSGVSEGDLVAISGVKLLQDGQEVRKYQ